MAGEALDINSRNAQHRALHDCYARCLAEWSLITAGAPFPSQQSTLVAPVTRADGRPAVIKLVASAEDFSREVLALAHFDGLAPRLIATSPSANAFLMERIAPGTTLHDTDLSDVDAIAAVALLMQRIATMSTPSARAFPSLMEWFRAIPSLAAFEHAAAGRELIAATKRVAGELDASSQPHRLLHGDLHHHNVIADGAGWRLLDPKGVIGDPAYEPAVFIRNRLDADASDDVLCERTRSMVEQFSALLGYAESRLVAWLVAHCVLSAAWSAEDGEDWQPAMRIASAANVLAR
ncbi:MAG: aminoglycoside phosphotransferase family protein [Rhodocyclaceae bacterium]